MKRKLDDIFTRSKRIKVDNNLPKNKIKHTPNVKHNKSLKRKIHEANIRSKRIKSGEYVIEEDFTLSVNLNDGDQLRDIVTADPTFFPAQQLENALQVVKRSNLQISEYSRPVIEYINENKIVEYTPKDIVVYKKKAKVDMIKAQTKLAKAQTKLAKALSTQYTSEIGVIKARATERTRDDISHFLKTTLVPGIILFFTAAILKQHGIFGGLNHIIDQFIHGCEIGYSNGVMDFIFKKGCVIKQSALQKLGFGIEIIDTVEQGIYNIICLMLFLFCYLLLNVINRQHNK